MSGDRPPSIPRSSLGPLVGDSRTADELQRDAWHRHGWLRISPADRDLAPDQRGVIEAIGVARFGPRRVRDH